MGGDNTDGRTPMPTDGAVADKQGQGKGVASPILLALSDRKWTGNARQSTALAILPDRRLDLWSSRASRLSMLTLIRWQARAEALGCELHQVSEAIALSLNC